MDDDSGVEYLYSLFGKDFEKETEVNQKQEYKVVAKLSLLGQNCYVSIQNSARKLSSPPIHISYAKNKLTFDLPELDKHLRCQLEVPEAAFSTYLHKKFHPEKFTKSEIRTTLQFLADSDLAYSAGQDHVSLETKKSHYKSAASKMGISKQARLVSTLLSGILIELSYDNIPNSRDTDKSKFLEYCENYLPNTVRQLTLVDDKGLRHRVLDMGNLSGRPVIILSSMVLPDFRPSDIQSLVDCNIRMLWPLHYGALSPSDPPMDEENQLQHCIDGIEQLRELFCGEKITLVPLITAAWYGIRYAERYPSKIESLIFVAACYRKQNYSRKTPKLLSDGFIAVAKRSGFLLDKVLHIAKEHFGKSDRFARMLEKKYEDSEPDYLIMQTELKKFPNAERYYHMLSNSLSTIRHDFQLQYDIGWERLEKLDLQITFIHGMQDKHTPISYIQELIKNDIPHADLCSLIKCGQLVYYRHFKSIVKIISHVTNSG